MKRRRPQIKQRDGGRRRFFYWLLSGAVLAATGAGGHDAALGAAADLDPLLRELGSTDTDKVRLAVTALADKGDVAALPALEALNDDNLKVAPDGAVYLFDAKERVLKHPLTGATVVPEPANLRGAETNNEIRRVLEPVLAQLKLGAADPRIRLAAAEELAKGGGASATPLLRKALAAEADSGVKEALSLAVARIDLTSEDPAKRIGALQILKQLGKGTIKGEIESLLKNERDPQVKAAANAALGSMRTREFFVSAIGHVLYGLSLASVFLFAALGLAITFGVMGVINMAHGEMLTIGAYTTYAVQVFFQKHFPGAINFYLVAAIPLAFAVATLAGVALERGVIRFLYGRPLETLLATWGISLCIIQTVRLFFGASNVAVANPSWLAGGYEVASGLVLSYSRIGVVVFVIIAALFVWLLLQKTTLGLQLRAVTQNRSMAACMGINTRRVDMLTFGLGSGIAGLGGVALSQLGNVGPELGQSYILDSFMVVVLGGVGRIAGTIGAALGLGIIQKLMEPSVGAVLGKIAVLSFIILFIQRRPQGMFPVKGRIEA